jgi:hypothetical protein
MSAPYWVRLRGCGGPDEWDQGRRFGGEDSAKGIEVLAASWDGAVIVRMRKVDGKTRMTISEIPWGRPGQTKGRNRVIFDGDVGDG